MLQCDGSQHLSLGLYGQPLLGFNGLVQAVTVSPSFHDPAGLLIHDLHLVIHDHIFDILLKEGIGF